MAERNYTVVIMRYHSGLSTVKERMAPSDLTDEKLDCYGIHVSAEIALRALDRGATPFHYVWDDWFEMSDGLGNPPPKRKAPLVRRSACWLMRGKPLEIARARTEGSAT